MPSRTSTLVAALVVLFAGACGRSVPSRSSRRAAAAIALSEGERLLASKRARESSRYLFRAVAAYREAGDGAGEAASLYALGRVHLLEKRHATALAFFSRVAKHTTDARARARASVARGETLAAIGHHEDAVAALESALRYVGPTERARAFLSLALAQRALGRLRRSRAAADEARALGAASRGETRGLLVDLLVDLGEPEQAFELSQGVTLERVQAVLDADRRTRALVYVLGERRSLLWEVSPSGLKVHTLDAGSALESLASDTRRSLAGETARRQTRSAELAARAVAALLGPVELGGTGRLVVVSEGALAALPFGSLPLEGGPPLISRFEVVRLASLERLPVLRARSGRSFAKWVAIAADPSYGLNGARLEARAIERLAPRGMVEVTAGSEADSRFVLGAAVGRFRFLHLATHGIEGRGLVLGDAVMGRAELARAELRVETVVLSACASDLADVLLDRGARRVISSHWRVDDEATAELMSGLYARLFSGAAPGTALREAQLAMWESSRFHAPRYWAAFELHGDWAP